MKELTKTFGGGRAGYQSLIKEIEQHLYARLLKEQLNYGRYFKYRKINSKH